MTVLTAPSPVFATTGRRPRRHVSAAHRTRANDLWAQLIDVVGPRAESLLDWDAPELLAGDHLAGLARACVSESEDGHLYDGAQSRDLMLLALDMQQLALDMHGEELANRNRRLNDCADALERLRGLPHSSDVIDTLCDEVVVRGAFGRVTISAVEDGMWIPRKARFANADVSWFADWVGQGIPLSGATPEARLLTERRPALVADTGVGPVHRDIIVESGQSQSYVVAPVMSKGSVIGFLHGDHFPEDRTATEVDRDVIWAFAEGFARIHERAVLLERLTSQRAHLEGVLAAAVSTLPEALGARIGVRSLTSGDPELLADLTTREREVFELMAAGSTNRAIATRLVITEDTVKSHVKQVLRKMGVANRAQAIARAAGTAVA